MNHVLFEDEILLKFSIVRQIKNDRIGKGIKSQCFGPVGLRYNCESVFLGLIKCFKSLIAKFNLPLVHDQSGIRLKNLHHLVIPGSVRPLFGTSIFGA